MGYRVVRLTELMAYEFGQVEGDIGRLDERALGSALPQGMSYSSFMDKLKSGELALLTDSPSKPVMLRDGMSKSWSLSAEGQEALSPEAKSAYLSRTRMSGGAAGSATPTQSSAGYAPNIEETYVPEPVKPDTSDAPPKLQYEYCFEVACSDETFRKSVGYAFELAKTQQESLIGRWQTEATEHGTKYTAHTAFDEPKKLVAKVASNALGMSVPDNVQVKPIGSGVVREAFIPVVPSVQLGERLGLPTEGYYYHFYNGRLVQEYKLLGNGKWAFYATRSTHEQLNDEQGYNIYQSSILVYWKLEGKDVENQHLIYLEQPITREELDNLNDDWLAQHGIKLDINELLAAPKQPVAERQTLQPAETEKAESKPETHTVGTDSNTNQRESWAAIAEQYGLSAKQLLDLNPQYNADPMLLSVGHSLRVSQPNETQAEKNKVYAKPPAKPEIINPPLDTYYEFSDSYLADTHVKAINHERLIEKDIPIVNLKEVTPRKVFAKSCQLPQGCIDVGTQEESIQNFGPWSFFFGQAQASPMVIPVIEATQAQMAMGTSAAMVGQAETSPSDSSATELQKLAGTLKDKLVDSYRWKVEGIGALFAMQQSLLGDGTQYSDKELRQLSTVQSRLRVHITEPDEGEYYPHVKAYHVDDTRIPVKYVAEGDNNQLSVQLEDEGPIIYWTPADSGDPSWKSTPSQDDGFELDDMLVTPIHSDETATTITPMPEEKDWRDAILVFPESSGIAPLYVVYKESPRDKPGTVTGQGKDVPWKDGYWLGQAANEDQGQYIPTKIADALRGKEFNRFADLQTAIWKEVAKNPELFEQFDKRNKVQIQKGNAPICLPDYQKGGRIRYEIHHITQIQHGGEVYHIDNLRINTAKNHIRIHSNEK
ncbi:TPA: S-type Pyocin domain-containing protein [Vibrio cholerae]|nr:S-type Pyocin domain-containing protein [Vibrio cholerae]